MSAERPQFGLITERTFYPERDTSDSDGLWGRTPSEEAIGPRTQEFLGYDKYGFDYEALDKGDLSFCVDALRQARYEHLIPLLHRETESAFLGGVKNSLTRALDSLEMRGQSLGKKEIKGVRMRVEEEIQELGFKVPLQIIPPEKLWGICGEDYLGRLQLTDIGQAVELTNREFPSLSLFLIGGIAREVLGIKPRTKTRERLFAHSFDAKLVYRTLKYPDRSEIKLPPADIDLLAVSATGRDSLDKIARLLYGRIFKESLGGKVWAKESSQRKGLRKLNFGTKRFYEEWISEEFGRLRRRLREEYLLGELFPPPFAGNYGFQNRLLPYLMAQSRGADLPILLIPHYNRQERKSLVWGVAMDFFDGFKDNRHQSRIQWAGHYLRPSYYPFPEIAFPIGSPPDSLWRLRYLLRTLAWDNKLPILHSVARDRLDELEPGTIRRFLAKETQEYLTEEVIYYLARVARERPEKFGNREQRKEMATAFVKEDFPLAFDGDPLATTVRCLPAGENYQAPSPDKDVLKAFPDLKARRGFPLIYGWGIFDNKGFFPELGKFLMEKVLLEEGRRPKQVKRQDLLIEKMRKCPHGGIKWAETTGWQEFLNFLFEQTGYKEDETRSAQRVAELLTPVIYPGDWKRFVKDCLLELDALRFAKALERPSRRDKILSVLMTTTTPLTTKAIEEEVGLDRLYPVLVRMEERGEVVRLGGKRKKYADGRSIRLGGGGYRVTWVSPEFYEEEVLADALAYVEYFAPQRAILTVLAQGGGRNRHQLTKVIGRNFVVVEAALDLLIEAGKVAGQVEKREGDIEDRLYFYLAGDRPETDTLIPPQYL